MPIYEFECPNCGYEFELIRSFSDNSAPVCPQCANEQVNRQVGRPAIHFKGSGWYINDSKKASKSSANGKESGGEDSGSGDNTEDSGDKKSTDSASGADAKSGDKKGETTVAKKSSSKQEA